MKKVSVNLPLPFGCRKLSLAFAREPPLAAGNNEGLLVAQHTEFAAKARALRNSGLLDCR